MTSLWALNEVSQERFSGVFYWIWQWKVGHYISYSNKGRKGYCAPKLHWPDSVRRPWNPSNALFSLVTNNNYVIIVSDFQAVVKKKCLLAVLHDCMVIMYCNIRRKCKISKYNALLSSAYPNKLIIKYLLQTFHCSLFTNYNCSTAFVSVHLISSSHICISPLSSVCPCKWGKTKCVLFDCWFTLQAEPSCTK